MLGQWLIFAGMVLFSLALLLRPLLQGKGAGARPAGAHDLEVYRDQLRELARDEERGLIGRAEAEAARTEIERRALAAGKEADETPTRTPSPMPRIALAVTILIPVAAGLLYFSLGEPEARSRAASEEARATDAAERGRMVRGMVRRLETRLEANPDDAQGWRLLGRSYFVLGRREASIRAYGRAATLAPGDPAILMDYATAIILTAPESERPPVRALPVLRRLRELQPGNPLALYFLGIAAARDGDTAAARENFEQLLERLPENNALREEVKGRLQALPAE